MAFDLTLTGATYGAAKFSTGLTGGRGQVSGVLPTGGALTVNGWVKTVANATGIVVCLSQPGAFWIGIDGAGKAIARYGDGGAEVALSSAVAINDNTFHHLELCVDASGGKLFVDGVLVASSATSYASASVKPAANPLEIGTLLSGYAWPFGAIDDVAVWNTALHTASFTPPTAPVDNSALNLVAVWHLNGDGVNSQGAASGAATATTLTGPASGAVGTASANFSVAANGSITGTVVITPSDGGGGGTFSPTTVSINTASPTGTFKYTPASTGAKTIATTNNGGLTNPSAATYTASAASTTLIPANSPSITFSPYNWDALAVNDFGVSVVSAQTTCCGAYFKFRVSGTAGIALALDSSALAGFGGNTPLVAWSVDYGAEQSAQLTVGAASLPLASGLSTGSGHDVLVWLKGSVESQGTRWGSSSTVSPTNVLRIQGIVLDSGGAIAAWPSIKSKKSIMFGDSITEGVRASGTLVQPADHARSFASFLGLALDTEYGVVGYGLSGWAQGGNGSVPAFPSGWNFLTTGRSRSFSAPPDYVFVMHGTNGSTPAATVAAWLASARAAFGAATWIFLVNPPNGGAGANLLAGLQSYLASNPSDARAKYISPPARLGTAWMSGYAAIDLLHPLEFANGIIGATVASLAQAEISALQVDTGNFVINLGGVGLTSSGKLVAIA